MALAFDYTAAELLPLLPKVQEAVAGALSLPSTPDGVGRVRVAIRGALRRRLALPSQRRLAEATPTATTTVDVSVAMPSADAAAATADATATHLVELALARLEFAPLERDFLEQISIVRLPERVEQPYREEGGGEEIVRHVDDHAVAQCGRRRRGGGGNGGGGGVFVDATGDDDDATTTTTTATVIVG